MESEDYAFYQGLVYLMDNNVEHLGYDLTFSTEVCQQIRQYTGRFTCHRFFTYDLLQMYNCAESSHLKM